MGVEAGRRATTVQWRSIVGSCISSPQSSVGLELCSGGRATVCWRGLIGRELAEHPVLWCVVEQLVVSYIWVLLLRASMSTRTRRGERRKASDFERLVSWRRALVRRMKLCRSCVQCHGFLTINTAFLRRCRSTAELSPLRTLALLRRSFQPFPDSPGRGNELERERAELPARAAAVDLLQRTSSARL